MSLVGIRLLLPEKGVDRTVHNAPVFALLAALCAWQAAAVFPGASCVPLGMGAVTLGVLAATYACPQFTLRMKGPDGRIRPWAWAVLWPYFLLSILTLLLVRAVTGERALNEVLPGLYLGRYLFPWERGSAPEMTAVLDLTWEFNEARFLRSAGAYRCIPLPDTGAPTLQQLEEGVNWLRRSSADGNVYVHCALGHGRSATFVAAYLILTGEARNAEEAVSKLRETRPGVGLNPAQRKVLDDFAESLR